MYHAELPDPAGSCILEESKEHTSIASMTSQEMSASIYRGLFTDGEWEVIDRALSEYQDHLDDPDSEYSEEDKTITLFKQRFTQFSNSLRKTDARV